MPKNRNYGRTNGNGNGKRGSRKTRREPLRQPIRSASGTTPSDETAIPASRVQSMSSGSSARSRVPQRNHVSSDIKKIGVIAVALVVILIVLSIVL